MYTETEFCRAIRTIAADATPLAALGTDEHYPYNADITLALLSLAGAHLSGRHVTNATDVVRAAAALASFYALGDTDVWTAYCTVLYYVATTDRADVANIVSAQHENLEPNDNPFRSDEYHHARHERLTRHLADLVNILALPAPARDDTGPTRLPPPDGFSYTDDVNAPLAPNSFIRTL